MLNATQSSTSPINYPEFGKDLECTYYVKGRKMSDPWQKVKGLVFDETKNAINKIIKIEWESNRRLFVTLKVDEQARFAKFALSRLPDFSLDNAQNTVSFYVEPNKKEETYLFFAYDKKEIKEVNHYDLKDVNSTLHLTITDEETIVREIAHLKFVSAHWVLRHKDYERVIPRVNVYNEIINNTYYKETEKKCIKRPVLVGCDTPAPKKTKTT